MEIKHNPYGGQPTCYVLIGPPACGKSTWVLQHMLTACNPTHIASTDDIIEEIARERGVTYSDIWAECIGAAEKQFKQDMFEAIRNNHDVIIDRTNMTVAGRRKIRSWLTSNTKEKYRLKAVIFEYDEEVLKERLAARAEATGKNIPWSVVQAKISEYQAPVEGEFDLLTLVKK